MRRAIAAILLIAGCFALYALQRTKAEAPISAAPVLYFVADTEREAERIPLALTRVSDADENKIGAQIAREYGLTDENYQPREKSGDSATIEKYLNSVGSRLTSGVQRATIHYHFYLDEDPYLINAFALPGGNIVVGRGLLNLLESEDELAFILGHEITHVDDRHSIERLQYELAARKYGLSIFYQLGRPGIEIFRAGYTKEQELEADRVGLGFAVNADFSRQGAVDVMRRFEILEAERIRSAARGFSRRRNCAGVGAISPTIFSIASACFRAPLCDRICDYRGTIHHDPTTCVCDSPNFSDGSGGNSRCFWKILGEHRALQTSPFSRRELRTRLARPR